MALVVLLPLFTAVALFAIHRGSSIPGSWRAVLILQAALSLSSWVAVETGERDEDYYEHGQAERVLEQHEELAEVFLAMTLVAFPLAAAGLLRGRAGRAARAVYCAGTVGLLILGATVGHRGGELIYPEGARATAERLSSQG